jgi:hypothetical protein
MHELKLPSEALNDPDALELLRVWLRRDAQGFAFRTEVWGDPALWGLLLVDLARHIAYSYSKRHGENSELVLSRIKAGFYAEWSSPTNGFSEPP